MKIEKLTENKIRAIIKQEDIKNKNINLEKLIQTSVDSQDLLLDILEKAKKELNFNIDGCKLLIETFSSSDDIFIFTITKYNISNKKRYLSVKRKNPLTDNYVNFFKFSNFDDFCNFCNSLKNLQTKGLYKSATLYLYNNKIYLLINKLNSSHKNYKLFCSYILEFSKQIFYSKNFEAKLKEHGKIIIKNNALNIGIKYFSI